jgi:DNA-binding MarR family transcriptional regulator/GNAT superfamily N-acetyltransferase
MDQAMIRQVRQFNRTVTERIGALDDAFLARGRPLGQARLLWEIGPGGAEVRALRGRLGLDSGYLSRLLRSLEADGLITTGPGRADARVRMAWLTSAGRAERSLLDQLSDEQAAAILAPLSGPQRARLTAAMAEAGQLLTASAIQVGACDPGHRDARFCLQEYFAELGRRFDGGFDPAQSLPASDAELIPPAGVLLVATLRAEPAGCGALKFRDRGPAEIKRMWVSPSVRGLGLGRRLLVELEAQAASRGIPALRLETNRALTEAIGLYRASGYHEVPAFSDEPYATFWFEKTLLLIREDPDPRE